MGSIATALALLALSTTSFAHDFWLQPDKPRAAVGAEVSLELWQGDSFKGAAEKPLELARTVRLEHWSAPGGIDLLPGAVDGTKPFATRKLQSSGGHLFALQRNAAREEMLAKDFNQYLREEGLLRVLDHRKRHGQLWEAGRERYTRYVKALVQVGDKRDEIFKRSAGHAIEIIPSVDPTEVAPGLKAHLEIKLLFRDKPLAFGRLTAYCRLADGKIKEVVVNTRPDGIAKIPVRFKGTWMLRAIHMEACEGCDDADWQSFWTTFLFANG